MLLASAESQSLPPLAFHGNATRFGQLLANGVPFSLKGVTWPGLETELTAPVFADAERATGLAARTTLGRNGR